MKNIFNNKGILITGGTGTIGSALVKRILNFAPKVIRVFDNDENALYNLWNELKKDESKLRYLLGDIRDKERLDLAMEEIDIVYHAAALKHVPLCEYNPFETVKTNVIGTQNTIESARHHNVKKFVFISTDKSVEPVNTMGATKLLGERLTIDANYYRGFRKIKFSSVRFGNVLNSRGSIIPLCLKQIKKGKPLTITNKKMTRFIITIDEAINFVLKATRLMKGGETFVIKNMKSVKIIDLIKAIRELCSEKFGLKPKGIHIETIGERGGEKLDEFLMTKEEAVNALEEKDLFILLPSNHFGRKISANAYKDAKPAKIKYFSSREGPKLTKKEIKELLIKEGFATWWKDA